MDVDPGLNSYSTRRLAGSSQVPGGGAWAGDKTQRWRMEDGDVSAVSRRQVDVKSDWHLL